MFTEIRASRILKKQLKVREARLAARREADAAKRAAA